MPEHDLCFGHAHCLCHKHEILIFDRHDLRAHRSGIKHPAGKPDYHDDVHKPVSENGDDCESQNQKWNCKLHIGDAHDHVIPRAALEAAEQTERYADQRADAYRANADQKRDPGAINDPAEDIAPQRIGSKNVVYAVLFRKRRAQTVYDINSVRIKRSQHIRKNGHQHYEGEDDCACRCNAAFKKIANGFCKGRSRFFLLLFHLGNPPFLISI